MGVGAGAAGVAALAVHHNRALPAPKSKLHVLDASSFGVLVCLTRFLMAKSSADPMVVAHDVDAALRYASAEAQADTRLALKLLENSLAGALTRMSPRLFSRLKPKAQARALDIWSRSPLEALRAASLSLRKLCYGACYARMDQAKSVGYPGPFFQKGSPGPIEARAPLSTPYVPGAGGGQSVVSP